MIRLMLEGHSKQTIGPVLPDSTKPSTVFLVLLVRDEHQVLIAVKN